MEIAYEWLDIENEWVKLRPQRQGGLNRLRSSAS